MHIPTRNSACALTVQKAGIYTNPDMISDIMDKWITLRMSYYQRRHGTLPRSVGSRLRSLILCPGPPLSMDCI